MKLSFQQIVFYPEITPDDKKRSMDKLTEIRGAIVDGKKSFETMARIHSMDPGSAQQGGLISASKGMMVPQFESTVFNLKPGKNFEIEHKDLKTSFGPIFCGCETATIGINSLQAKSTVPICDSCINKFVEYWNEI